MSNFSIHLSEPLSDSEAKRVALLTAPALGGSPEKLQLLLSRQSGSRIARASSQRQADTVANILRSAGVKVDVLENASEAEAVAPTAIVPAAIPEVVPKDLFASPSIPPLSPPAVDSFVAPKPVVPEADSVVIGRGVSVPSNADFTATKTDSFVAQKANPLDTPKSDPFAAPKSDPFAAPKSDPFAAPKSDPFAAPKSDPFAAPKSDPFAAPKSDPFVAPQSDPFAAPKSDPFAAPLATRTANENSFSPDPFAAPGMGLVQDTKDVSLNDMPAQARKARDRAIPRTSVRNQMLGSLIIPYFLVAIGTIAFVAYQLPQVYREELGLRAYQAALGEAEANYEIIEQLPAPAVIAELQAEVKGDLKQTPEATAIIYEAKVMAISGENGELAAFASQVDMTAKEANGLDAQFDDLEEKGLKYGTINFRGVDYMGALAEVEAEDNENPNENPADKPEESIGNVHILFSLSEIPNRVFQAIIPLLIALGVIFIFALFLANALAARLSRPIISATEQANRIALGDLDRGVVVNSNDEIGDMLGSLERMRVSLKSMVARMRRNT
jgi:HAMP domain-containing protein